MATFRAGQRVRVSNRGPVLPEFVGAEARFVCYGVPPGWRGREFFRGVLLDCTISVNGIPDCAAVADLLDPLTDPGRKVVSWEGAIWMPEHMRESVEGVNA
jgi:hypothetical protein